MYPEVISKLVEDFKKFPGVGEKTAERMAFSILDLNLDDVKKFSDDLLNIKLRVKTCNICGALTDKDICQICSSKDRNKEILCVVEDVKDVFLLEKMGNFNGLYHVLGGLISPIDGIGIEDLNIEKLKSRISNEKIKEIILAIKGTIEGETTALYIKKLFENSSIVVSKIASGIPIGAEMDYIDVLTLESAFKNRKEI